MFATPTADPHVVSMHTTENVHFSDDVILAGAAADHMKRSPGYRWWRGHEDGMRSLPTIAGTELEGLLQFQCDVAVRDTPGLKPAWTLLSAFGSALLATPEVNILGAVFGDLGPTDTGDAEVEVAADGTEDKPETGKSNFPVRFHHVGPAIAATAVALMNRWRELQEQVARDMDELDETEEFLPQLPARDDSCAHFSGSRQAIDTQRTKRLSLARALTIAYQDDPHNQRT
jgi:hypothetical protein